MAATIKDIAKLTGVSHSAVSYVLNGKGRVSEETRRRILETAQEIGYVPNRNARNLAKKVYGKIGLFIPGLEYLKTSFFFNNLVSGVLSVVEQTGNDLFLGLTKDDYQNFLNRCSEIREHKKRQNNVYENNIKKRIQNMITEYEKKGIDLSEEEIIEAINNQLIREKMFQGGNE